MDVDRTGVVDHAALLRLATLDLNQLARCLPQFDEFLSSADGAVAAIVGRDSSETASAEEFAAGCQRAGYSLKIDLLLIFAALDTSRAGRVGAPALAALRSYAAGQKWRRLSACKSFVMDNFESAEAPTFKTLFDDPSEFFSNAETKEPRVEWEKNTVVCYRGRKWLQQLLNTIRDSRGRNLTGADEAAIGGSWMYSFPYLRSVGKDIDFKDAPDPATQTQARAARWHRGQAFLDLRRLAAPAASDSDGAGPVVEFRSFISQAALQPKDVNEAGDMPKAPFGTSRMYVKGTIQLDRPLAQLCPRDIAPMPTTDSGESLIPPPPEKKPPPTVSEELELEGRRLVGQLAHEFARMCKERGLEEPQAGDPGAEQQSPKPLLGRGLELGKFMEWLKEQDDGGVYSDLGAQLRPAVVRLVRSDIKDGPTCGLTGNEKDAKYSSIRDYILTHLFRALNHDVSQHRYRRDGSKWRSPALTGSLDDRDPNFASPSELTKQKREKDLQLQRLVFEYEMLGDFDRATELFKEQLALPQNAENGDSWYKLARFFMRCGQRQVEAEDALRFAISLRPVEAGPSFNEAAFLACILQNYALPCSMQSQRFEAAQSLLATYADKHPDERTPLYFLFIISALEAWGLQAEAGAAAEVMQLEKQPSAPSSNAGTTVSSPTHAGTARGVPGANAAAEAMERSKRLSAEAAKYLALARAPPELFNGTFASNGGPSFPELDALVKQEQLKRGEAFEVPAKPETPSAWCPTENEAFTSYESRHAMPAPDDSAALQCIDLMLHFGIPSFASFLIGEASEIYNFISPATAMSERCQLQLVKAEMLRQNWDEAISLILELFRQNDRLCEAHVLLGECYYRRARGSGALGDSPAAYDLALEAYERALGFFQVQDAAVPLPDQARIRNEDPVVHLRIASIYFMRAEQAGFSNMQVMTKAMDHYRRSLLLMSTAEGWRCAGVCAYRMARLSRQQNGVANSPPPMKLFGEALKFLTEANLLDVQRPQIYAWLVICAVETGQVQVAKQSLRQVFSQEERLDAATACELAVVLLRFSGDPKRVDEASGLVRSQVVLGQYAREAGDVARLVISKKDTCEARLILAQSLVILGEDEAAVREFRNALCRFDRLPSAADEALPEDLPAGSRLQQIAQQLQKALEDGDHSSAQQLMAERCVLQAEVTDQARACAARLIGEPAWAHLVEQDIQAAIERCAAKLATMQAEQGDTADPAAPPAEETFVDEQNLDGEAPVGVDS
eukprot:gnl/TRDRNA2_/TRDRNA2_132089_c2_seq1.p1 gnl/TRDRNA2_/TRDRNA2_132089_c2~~gnl/TRDRNA2_/TRDRNA2_132089_c2_seq1.p1  ORF type:complete len:1355 (-),score=333.17 gnl/TRDRNA2_/TRDRNA2_132089_c2_seq1:41-3775(-)